MTDDTKKITQQNINDDETFSDSDDQSMLSDTEEIEDTNRSGRGNQGFASMSKQKQREIASKGGKAAHIAGTAHEWNSEEAAAAGRRGGQRRSSVK